ncbi:molybdopterin oxidoreductase family protein [Erythrobacter sp. SCSIO 43205]|uniref:molybdopterin oxidoreductase family protein n=1 Tax=Erythrobacter sp. SCSIO 43205 TaxID=2779361 RepID=UPI001CA94947|nr:molybdopterin oxidoreductase family protein [Erythrobacter sp. SCSIO 43205]UAB77336.1 molybdopterin oxidoreductase family protein [Erythrobacter sp. SCSIO 43205]
MSDKPTTTIHKRTCHICEANCGILVEVEGRRVLSIKGNPDNALSRGYICPKATAIADLQDDPDRLRTPMKRVGEAWEPMGWDEAYREIAAKVAELDPDGAATAFYRGNPTAHDYALVLQSRHLQRAVGAKRSYSASTLDQMPHHYVQYQMYGHVSLAAVPDIDRTKAIVILGGNPMASNGSLWTVPDFRGRLRELHARGGTLTVVDPRRTETAKLADQWVPIKPGTDTALLIAILKTVLEAKSALRPGLAEVCDDGLDTVREAVERFDTQELSAYCGVSPDEIAALAKPFTGDEPAAIYGRMGVSVCEFGALNQWLVQLINLASGNLDRAGGTMFPKPLFDLVGLNGRGGVSTVDTARGTLPSVMGETPMVAFADEMLREDEGRIRVLFVQAGNPVLSAPDGNKTEEGLKSLDLMVAFDPHITETTRHAHYILPPCGPLEKDHFNMFFGPLSVRNFGAYSKPTLEIEEGAKADSTIVEELALAVHTAKGTSAPNIQTPRDQLDAMLKASPAGMSLVQVEAMEDGVDLGPLEPCIKDRLRTDTGKINVAPTELVADLERFAKTLDQASDDALRLIGRRHVRSNNSWLHNSRRLVKGPDRCTLMIHPEDAEARGIGDGETITITSNVTSVETTAEVTEDVMRGVVSLPHGWGHNRKGVSWQTAADHAGVSINDLIDTRRYDALTGNAVLNGIVVEVAPVKAKAIA